MYDGVSRSELLQRAAGTLRVSVKRRGEASVLDGLRQEGCLKARFSRPLTAGWFDITTLNTSGGVAGGDILTAAFVLGEGTRAVIASQAAERFYRALPDSAPSTVRTDIRVGAGAAAEWLPQETILFDRCAVDRHLTIAVAPGASFLGVETLVFGRAAMGERVVTARLRDRLSVRRGEELLLHDAIRLEGEVDSLLEQPALGGGARAVATLVYVASDAESRLEALREAAPACGASAWNGMLVARVLAADGAAARATVLAALAVLRGGRALPRVWAC